MNNEKKEYVVLKPISFKSDRVERGAILLMTEAEAFNIGEEYVQLAQAVEETNTEAEDTGAEEDTEESEESEETEKPVKKTAKKGKK